MSKNLINVWSYLEEHEKEEEEILEIVKKVFNSGKLILGKNVELFEKEFSQWIGKGFGVGVGNGTDAIKLAILALNIKKGDEIITVSNTAVPTISAIIDAGAIPVFCDVDPSTFNIDIKKISSLINKKTKAILAVHLYGYPANVFELKKIAKKNNLFLIEDCAQAHGSKYKDKKCGDFGDISAFSFYPTKTLGGYGDGGLVYTKNKTLYKRLKMLRFYGMKTQYYSLIDGVNSRLDEVHAAILRYKLNRLDSDIARRREIANIYNSELKDTNLILPKEEKDYFHSYYLYVVRSKLRNKIINDLKDKNINLNISYKWPIHTMPPFRKYKKGNLDYTNQLSKEIFSLPMYPGLSNEKVYRVIESIKKIVNKNWGNYLNEY